MCLPGHVVTPSKNIWHDMTSLLLAIIVVGSLGPWTGSPHNTPHKLLFGSHGKRCDRAGWRYFRGGVGLVQAPAQAV